MQEGVSLQSNQNKDDYMYGFYECLKRTAMYRFNRNKKHRTYNTGDKFKTLVRN